MQHSGIGFLSALILLSSTLRVPGEEITPHLHVISGAVNSALIEDDETTTVIYRAGIEVSRARLCSGSRT